MSICIDNLVESKFIQKPNIYECDFEVEALRMLGEIQEAAVALNKELLDSLLESGNDAAKKDSIFKKFGDRITEFLRFIGKKINELFDKLKKIFTKKEILIDDEKFLSKLSKGDIEKLGLVLDLFEFSRLDDKYIPNTGVFDEIKNLVDKLCGKAIFSNDIAKEIKREYEFCDVHRAKIACKNDQFTLEEMSASLFKSFRSDRSEPDSIKLMYEAFKSALGYSDDVLLKSLTSTKYDISNKIDVLISSIEKWKDSTTDKELTPEQRKEEAAALSALNSLVREIGQCTMVAFSVKMNAVVECNNQCIKIKKAVLKAAKPVEQVKTFVDDTVQKASSKKEGEPA